MKLFKKFILTLSLLLAFLCSSGQILYTTEGNDNFFTESGWDNFGETRSDVDPAVLTLTTENLQDYYVPVGNGLLVMFGIGTGYLLRKRKKIGKSFVITLLCAILMFGYGCKKQPINPNNDDLIEITFSPGHNRSNITEEGIVTFTANDVLHLWASGNGTIEPRYLGTLQNSSSNLTTFTGKVSQWYTGEKLSFYYIGINTPNTEGTTYIDFSDQSGDFNSESDILTNIAKHYHIGQYLTIAPDDAITTTFYGTLRNMMAIGVFDTSEFGDESNVKIISPYNLNSMVKINIDGSLEYCVAGADDAISGHITIGKGKPRTYVSLLPISDTEPAEVSLIFTSNNKISSSPLNIQIGNNYFIHPYTSDNSIIGVHINASEYSSLYYIDYPSPEACMSSTHLFTTASETHNGHVVTKKVVFSQGNLVYDHGRFKQHKNPWETCTISSNADINVNGEFDVFGWATSGFNYNQHIFQPYSNSTTQYSGSIGYGYGSPASGYKQSFFPDKNYRRSDWGWYQFGMGVYPEYQMTIGKSYWRTLGQVEWTYIFYTRDVLSTGLIDYSTSTEVTNGRFAKATLCGVTGVLLFPDTYTHPSSIHLSYINADGQNGYTANILSESDFNVLHEAGVEFFPINGYWDKTTETFVDQTLGYYWSCKTQKTDQAIMCKMTEKPSGSIYTTHVNKYQGLYVRLVFQVEGDIY